VSSRPTLIDFAISLKATPNPDVLRKALQSWVGPRAWTGVQAALLALIPALLAACTPSPKVEVQPPVPRLPNVQDRPDPRPEGASLAPLATPQQVVQAVNVGRPDPFAAVLTPRLVGAPATQHVAIAPGQQSAAGAGQQGPGAPAGSSKRLPPLEAPKGLLFQGVLQGPMGGEALVEYAPSEAKAGGARSGSLRVGDVGTGQEDSLLPPGWQVRAIDVDRGLMKLQAGTQSVTLQL